MRLNVQEKYPEFFNFEGRPDAKYYPISTGTPEGWDSLVDKLLADLKVTATVDIDNKPTFVLRIVQIKEKFGELRLYYSITLDEYDSGIYDELSSSVRKSVDTLIDIAVKKSAKTCVTCGSSGIMRNLGWVSPLCESHYTSILNSRTK